MTLRQMAAAAIVLGLLGALAGCQPAGDTGSPVYRPVQLERVAAGSLLDATPEEVAAARAEDRAIYQAELARQRMVAGSLSAQQSARRGTQLLRQEQRFDIAQRNAVWAERDLARAQRELRSAERLDTEPVFTSPFDEADALRRQRQIETGRAAGRAYQANRAAAQTADRGARLGSADAALERMRVMDRIDRRQAERERAAAGPADPLQRYLPYRRQGESVEALRDRVAAAEARSAATGQPVAAILGAERE